METENQNQEATQVSKSSPSYQNKIYFLIFLMAGLILGGAGGYYFGKNEIQLPSLNQQKGCTLEALQCPDGSAVGRSGPNCEFAPCPSLKPTVFSYPTPLTDRSSSSPISPRPSPLVLPDGSKKVITNPPLSLELTLPPSVIYNFNSEDNKDWAIYITLSSGKQMTLCTGCQLFMTGCDNLSEAGNCTSEEKNFGKLKLSEIHFKNQPEKIAGYYTVYAENKPYFRIISPDYTPLSSRDVNQLSSILDSYVQLPQ